MKVIDLEPELLIVFSKETFTRSLIPRVHERLSALLQPPRQRSESNASSKKSSTGGGGEVGEGEEQGVSNVRKQSIKKKKEGKRSEVVSLVP